MQQQFDIKCRQHQYKQAIFINIDQQNKILEHTCDTCAAQKNKNLNSKLLVLDELTSPDQNTILTNWPLLQNEDLLIRYDSIFQEFKNNKTKVSDLSEKVSQYFNSILTKFTSKIQNIEKQIQHNISQFSSKQLLQTYNEISQRDKLLQYFSDQAKMEQDIKNLIINTEKNCSEHERTLEQYCSKFEKFNNTFDEANMKKQFQKVFKIIDEIDSQEKSNCQQSNQISQQQNNSKQQETLNQLQKIIQTNPNNGQSTNTNQIQPQHSNQTKSNIFKPSQITNNTQYTQQQQQDQQIQQYSKQAIMRQSYPSNSPNLQSQRNNNLILQEIQNSSLTKSDKSLQKISTNTTSQTSRQSFYQQPINEADEDDLI